MKALLIALLTAALVACTARAQTLSQVYVFLAPLEGDTAQVIHRGNGEVVVGLGHDLPRDTGPHVTFSVTQRQVFLIGDYHKAMRAVHLFAPDYDHLPMQARLCLTSLYWTTGTTGLLRFKRMRYAINHRMWSMAAHELADSKRAHQIAPSRATLEYGMLDGLAHTVRP